MTDDLWPALGLSLKIAAVATAWCAAIGVPLAFLLRRRRFLGRGIVEALILLPMVLPPTVVGYLILLTLGKQGWLSPLLGHLRFVFEFRGAVVAAAVVALPMMYLPAKAAFAVIEGEVEDSARTLGAGPFQLFWRVCVPLARHGLLAGTVLAFARAAGEFGATAMVFGLHNGAVTLPMSVYLDFESGDLADAAAATAAMSVLSFTLVVLYNYAVNRRP
jgi:molybdate transport system permease protein